jgi:hypothetical protein
MTGTVTLGTNDTYVGTRAYLTRPGGAQVAMFLNLVPPAAGQTANYSAFVGGQPAGGGNWTATIEMSVISGGNPKVVKTSVNFTVP